MSSPVVRVTPACATGSSVVEFAEGAVTIERRNPGQHEYSTDGDWHIEGPEGEPYRCVMLWCDRRGALVRPGGGAPVQLLDYELVAIHNPTSPHKRPPLSRGQIESRRVLAIRFYRVEFTDEALLKLRLILAGLEPAGATA